jgi:hypothetical protein
MCVPTLFSCDVKLSRTNQTDVSWRPLLIRATVYVCARVVYRLEDVATLAQLLFPEIMPKLWVLLVLALVTSHFIWRRYGVKKFEYCLRSEQRSRSFSKPPAVAFWQACKNFIDSKTNMLTTKWSLILWRMNWSCVDICMFRSYRTGNNVTQSEGHLVNSV